MTETAALELYFSISEASVRVDDTHVKAAPSGRLGNVTVAGRGGTGAVTITCTEKPDWDTRPLTAVLGLNAGVYSLAALVPPFAGMKSVYRFSATDSATPTPATASIDLTVEAGPPTGYTLLPLGRTEQPLLVSDSAWRLLHHADVSLPATDRQENRRIHWELRRHEDQRLLFYVSHTFTFAGQSRKSVNRAYAYLDLPASTSAVCRELITSLACSELDAQEVWASLREHLPAFELA